MLMSRAVFLDRDGTINKDKKYLYRIKDCEYMEGAVSGLKNLTEMGYRLIIITNQSGIARGYYTENDYFLFMDWMIADLEKQGVRISGHYWCPHLPGADVKKYDVVCGCRKPKTGLFDKAIREHEIDLDNSFAIGDRLRDLAICKNTGVKGIILGDREKNEMTDFSYYRCGSWDEIVEYIKQNS